MDSLALLCPFSARPTMARSQFSPVRRAALSGWQVPRAEELRVRAEHMLLGDGERPRASGMAPVAPQATNALVLDLRDAVTALWKARADGIKASCASNVPVECRRGLEAFRH